MHWTDGLQDADYPEDLLFAWTRMSSSSKTAVTLTVICLGYFMTILDVTAVNVALPALQHALGASIADLQWVLDGYALVFASLLLTFGSLGDRRGSKGVFLTGVAVFTLASAGCGIAPTVAVLQAARVVQGIGAALLVPTSLALLRHTFSDSSARARAFGIYGGIAGIAAAAGPVLGGLLTSTVTWRAIFWLNVPIGLFVLPIAARVVPVAPRSAGRGFDPSGQAVGILMLVLLTASLIQSGTRGWSSPVVIVGLVTTAIACVIFIQIEHRAKAPMMPPALFRNASFSAGTAVGFLINCGFFGQLFLVNLFFQKVWGDSALLSGVRLLPEMGVVALASAFSGRVAGRFGTHVPMIVGTVVGGVGMLMMMTVGFATSYLLFIPMLIAIGFGMAFTMPAMTAAVMAAAPGEHAGIAGGVLNAARQSGTVVGVALLGALANRDSTFVQGYHVAVGVSGLLFLVASALIVVVASKEVRLRVSPGI